MDVEARIYEKLAIEHEGTLAQQQLEFDHRLNELQAQLNGSSGLHPRPGNDRR